jgi:hypothetical protein
MTSETALPENAAFKPPQRPIAQRVKICKTPLNQRHFLSLRSASVRACRIVVRPGCTSFHWAAAVSAEDQPQRDRKLQTTQSTA